MTRYAFMRMAVGLAVATAVTASVVPAAYAQRPRSTAERRLHPGRGFWANERASRNLRHARDYSRGIYDYSQRAARIESPVAKSESEQLGRNLDAAQRELDVVRAEFPTDEETLASLKAIDDHLARAAKTHEILHAESSKDSVDGNHCAACCIDITKNLEMALAEHDALVRKLELKDHVHTPPSDADSPN